MVKVLCLLPICLFLCSCSAHRLDGYNVKVSAGQTENNTGAQELYTGASADFHFKVK